MSHLSRFFPLQRFAYWRTTALTIITLPLWACAQPAVAPPAVQVSPLPQALNTPALPAPAPVTTPTAGLPASAPICQPAPACNCACPAPAAGPQAPAPLADYRGRLEKGRFADLPDWLGDDPREGLVAFQRSCEHLKGQATWAATCQAASALGAKPARAAATRFFETLFEPYSVINADESREGLVTGYYEPLLYGSRTKTERFKYPVHGEPQDLITVDLSEVLPELKHKRLRGRLVGNKIVPYLARADIETKADPLRGLEMAYVDDPIELFFLQIQGSGQIKLPDGSSMRVGYANQNGHPFRSLGGALIRAGEIRAEQASMQGIKAWAKANPAKAQDFMNRNPSFVFFKELRGDLPGPIGTLGAPLTAERSIAVDPRVVPLGPPVFISTTFPNTQKPLNRLVVAQDTGGAIAGGVRADFYWGFGDAAGAEAGRMKQRGRMWVLLPKGYTPEQINPTTGAKP